MPSKGRGSLSFSNPNPKPPPPQDYGDDDTNNGYSKLNDNFNPNPKPKLKNDESLDSNFTGISHDLETGADDDVEDYNYDDEEIQRDAANEVVAMVVYSFFIFFLVLFFGVTASIIIIVGKYGFVVFMILSVLFLIVLLLIRIVLNAIDRDRVLRPVRKKMNRWHAIATAVVINEMKNFHLDWNDHLLLTYDEEYVEENGNANGASEGDNGTRKKARRWKKPRSKLFGMIVQPLLKKKNGKSRFSRKKKKKNSNNVETVSSEDYAYV
mmetsp:Transcript_262/g.351  ORF Transcript_262/g.351 Transcript_262/m.351 type:complete len:267 (+) Transcript_262:84-884(+)|eukprot:CAMPEP_0203694336 /NCGR_PEP_ID=MMETSP0091-20130426/6083_1 /ASSEMBLY_ACC=CAM_ASM_001089 /TAXON_ID=426623 /ORGANISM="Chaetoceros affinis, Strain CCMP159" /LENGTH=266 /DNA_ID=CAMNT_0050565649 /DNA_START=37 /DNA_END=837 /DNA_ORIENTATION=+